jgi:hypothetical protein
LFPLLGRGLGGGLSLKKGRRVATDDIIRIEELNPDSPFKEQLLT